MTVFEELSTELLYEMFDYLSFNEIYHAFFGLQKRLNEAIRGYPTSIDLNEVSYEDMLRDGPFQCRSLVVKNVSLEYSERDESSITFQGTQSIEFSHTNCNTVLSVLNQTSMEELESIVIDSLNWECQRKNIYGEIWSKIGIAACNELRYLKVSLPTICENIKQLSSELSSLERAVVNNVSDEDIFVFLEHTPSLYSLTTRINNFCSDVHLYELNLPKLTYLNIRLNDHGSFESLAHLLSQCSNLIDFQYQCWSRKVDWEMLDPDSWQDLIEQYLPHLLYLTIQFYRYIPSPSAPDIDFRFDKSDYWISRRPDFTVTV